MVYYFGAIPTKRKITGLQNKSVKLVSDSKSTDKCGSVYKNLIVLRVHDLHVYKTAIFMYEFHNNKLLLFFQDILY